MPSAPIALRQRTIDANTKALPDTKALFDALVEQRMGFVKVAAPLYEKQESGQFAVVDCICPPSSETRAATGACASTGKHPLGAGWPGLATTDWGIAENWLTTGFSLGLYPLPGCRVIGLDEDEDDAIDNLFNRVDEEIPFLTTMADSIRGRMHLYLRVPDGYDIDTLPKGKFAGGDLLRDGLVRQFVAPNMLHPAGRRLWNRSTQITDASPALLDTLSRMALEAKTAIEVARSPKDFGWEVALGNRHDFLLTNAARLRNIGLTENAIYAGLAELNAERCKPPKTDDEIRKIARDYAKKESVADFVPITLDVSRTNGTTPLVIRPISSYTARRVDWLWDGWMPRAEPVILEGLGGVGKSTFVVDIMARLSRGDPMPDGAPNPFGSPTDSIYITGEDDPDRVLKPRMLAANADTDRIHFWADEFTVPDDIPRLANALQQRLDVKIVFIDPLFSHVASSLNTGSDAEVRKLVMNPLREIAHQFGVTVLIARHLNKKGGDDPILRGSGTYGGLTGAARSVIQSIPDPDDENKDRNIVGVIKANYGRMPKPWVYEIIPVLVHDGVLGEDISTSRIEYRWQHSKYIDQIVVDGRSKAATKGASRHEVARAKADEDITDILTTAGGASERNTVVAEMRRRGHSRDGAYAARDRVGVVTYQRDGNSGPYMWRLPEDDDVWSLPPKGLFN